jgi:hypothetical protein
MIMIAQKTGKLGFNSPSAKLLHEAGIVGAVLLWDTDKRLLVVRAPRKGEQISGKITFNSDHHSAGITSREFLRFIKWTATENKGISATWNVKEKQLEATIPAEFVGRKASPSDGGKQTPKRGQ